MEHLSIRPVARLVAAASLSFAFALAAQAEGIPAGCVRASDFPGSLLDQTVIVDKETDQGQFDSVFGGLMDSNEDFTVTQDTDRRTASGHGQRMLDFRNRNGETGGGDAARFLVCPAPPSV